MVGRTANGARTAPSPQRRSKAAVSWTIRVWSIPVWRFSLSTLRDYILNTPNLVSSMGALSAAEMPRPSTARVSAGSMMPSSHNRALA